MAVLFGINSPKFVRDSTMGALYKGIGKGAWMSFSDLFRRVKHFPVKS